MPADNGTVLGFGTAIRAENQILIIEKNSTSSVHPGITSSINLGTSSYAWAQIYGNGIHANVDGVNNAGGLSLCGTVPTTYGIAMRAGAAHGWIMANQTNANIARAYGISTSDATGTDWAVNFYNSGSKLRGWKFMFGTTTVASINGYGFMSVNRISLNRSSAEADLTNGRIYWGDASRYDWVDYVSDNADGAAPTGGKPSSLGDVTSWARRFSFGNASGYGWIWETTANSVATATTTTLTPRMALSSYTGRLQLAPNASSINVKTSGIIISSAENGSNGNAALELWKGTGTSWQLAAETDTFYLRNNKPRDAATVDTTSYSTDCFSITNEGDSWFPGEMKIGYKGQQYFRLYAATRGTTSAQGIARIVVGSETANNVTENSRGQIRLYHTNTSYADLQSNGWISDGVLEIFNFQGATSDTADTAAYTTVAIGNAQNVSAANNAHSEGRIYLYSAATKAHIIKGASTTTDYTHYFPNQSGWIAIGGDGSSTGVGSKGLPVYLSTAGVITVCTAGDITTTIDNQRKFVRLAGDTMTGALTVPSIFTVQAQNTTTEGGDICLAKAPDGTNDAHLDVYNNLFRIHNGSVNRFSIDLTAGGDATFTNGLVKITKNSNTLTIGSTNTSYCHFSNSADIPFWFNKVIQSDGGFTIYNTGDNHWRNGYLKINKTDGGDCYLELRRDTNADWRILSHSGNLYFQCNWTSEKVAYYSALTLDYNTGDAHFKRYVYASYFNASCAAETPADGAYWVYADSSGWLRKSSRANAVSKLDLEHKWVRVAGDTMTGQLTVTSTGSNRARVDIRSLTAVPMDLYLGSNNTNYWSISCRESTDPWLGFYYAGSGAGWALTCRTNKHVEIPVHAYVGGYNNTSYALSTASFICNSWVRTVGSTGWYNETYGGGWYMSDSTYIRNYNSKHVYITGRLGVDCELRLWGNTRQITRDARSVSWINGRDSSLLRESTSSGWHSVVTVKTGNGSWNIGEYNTSGWINYLVFSYDTDSNYNAGTNSSTTIRFRNNGVVESAMWNDYAECRSVDIKEPGRVVCETKDRIMTLANERLMPGCKVISDTFGFLIGTKDNCDVPIAVSGRVLVYPYQNRDNYELGAAVCSAPNGTVDIMTREEIMMYPERIIGTVSEIPNYETWEGGGVLTNDGCPISVNGRIWIYVK